MIAEIPQRIALSDVVKDLIGQSIPGIVDQSIEDFKLRLVSKPSTTIEGEHLEPGLSLMGTFGIVGLEMFVKVIIDPQFGIFAHGSLNKMVNVANALKVSDAAGTGPPSMTLDSTKSPYLKLTGRVDLLGLTDSIVAAVDKSGFDVILNRDLGIAQFKEMKTHYKSIRDCNASGSFTFGIDIQTDPIQLSPGTPSLGALKINAGFVGTVSIEVVDQTFGGSVTGGFHWNGSDFQIPAIKLSVVPGSLAELPKQVADTTRKEAARIFAEFLKDGNHWLKALADGLVQGVDNAAQVLRGVYSQTAQQIGDGLQNTLHQSVDQVAQGLKSIGESPQSIASVLHNLGNPPDLIGKALRGMGESAESIAGLLSQMGQTPKVIGDILGKAGFPASEAAEQVDRLSAAAAETKRKADEAAAAAAEAKRKADEAAAAAAAEAKRIADQAAAAAAAEAKRIADQAAAAAAAEAKRIADQAAAAAAAEAKRIADQAAAAAAAEAKRIADQAAAAAAAAEAKRKADQAAAAAAEAQRKADEAAAAAAAEAKRIADQAAKNLTPHHVKW